MPKLRYSVIIFFVWVSCSLKEESVSFDSSLSLIFSTDTVSFDTLLSERRSSTKRLTVYNPNEEAIQISSIRVGRRQNSDYSAIINGRASNQVNNETLNGGDSLLILLEVNISERDRNQPYLVKDSIVFNWNTNEADIKLVSIGQDATEVDGATICDETWTNQRPYIISDTVVVSPNCQLTIQEGASIYFENDAALFIQGSLLAIGDSAEHIVFRGARFDGIYDQVPGQWNGIYFLEGSTNNQIAYAEIFNGQIGLRVGTPDDDDIPDITVQNTEIYNMSVAGILAFTSDISATNTLIYNCGNYLVGGFAGGNYDFTHCTFSNEPALFVQDEPTVQFSDNVVISEDELLVEDLTVQLINSIVWGSNDEELLINNGGGANVTAILSQNIIRTSQELNENFVSQEFNFPGFKNTRSNDYSLDTLAFAKDKGADVGIDIDIRGFPRDDLPDIGSYERIEKQ